MPAVRMKGAKRDAVKTRSTSYQTTLPGLPNLVSSSEGQLLVSRVRSTNKMIVSRIIVEQAAFMLVADAVLHSDYQSPVAPFNVLLVGEGEEVVQPPPPFTLPPVSHISSFSRDITSPQVRKLRDLVTIYTLKPKNQEKYICPQF